MNLLARDQSCNTHLLISKTVDKHTYQSSEEWSPTFSKGKKPKYSFPDTLSACITVHIIWATNRKNGSSILNPWAMNATAIIETW